jgi:hypothetical protein
MAGILGCITWLGIVEESTSLKRVENTVLGKVQILLIMRPFIAFLSSTFIVMERTQQLKIN